MYQIYILIRLHDDFIVRHKNVRTIATLHVHNAVYRANSQELLAILLKSNGACKNGSVRVECFPFIWCDVCCLFCVSVYWAIASYGIRLI